MSSAPDAPVRDVANARDAALARFVRAHVAVTFIVTTVTAYFSYAYFNLDEYFQVIQLARLKLGQVDLVFLPWEHASKMRPWLQPFLYTWVGRAAGAVGVVDPFQMAFVWRLLTGWSCVASLALFLRTTLPWLATDEEKRWHVRIVTLTGFLPYLFVRTSSETLSMAAFTAGFSLVLAGATPPAPGERRWGLSADIAPRRLLLAGALLGLSFEARFQVAFMILGFGAWLIAVATIARRPATWLVVGGAGALAACALIDRWGYDEWVFPPLTYFRANLVEGVASMFGRDPPFAYLWMLPANVFFPVVVAFLVLAGMAWFRSPRHPITWTTLPFFVVHNLISHKEERFLFPMAILATAFGSMALAPSAGRTLRISTWGWGKRRGWAARLLAGSSFVMMAVLAFYPLGWNHHVRFTRWAHENIGEDFRAYGLLEFDLGLPAFHPRVYDVQKASPEEIVRRLDEPVHRDWLVTDSPILHPSSAALEPRATLVWSELPTYRDRALTERVMRVVDAYNASVRPPLKPVGFRSIYRLGP